MKVSVAQLEIIAGHPAENVSKIAFGFDLRESQNGVYFTQEYFKLKNKLLQK